MTRVRNRARIALPHPTMVAHRMLGLRWHLGRLVNAVAVPKGASGQIELQLRRTDLVHVLFVLVNAVLHPGQRHRAFRIGNLQVLLGSWGGSPGKSHGRHLSPDAASDALPLARQPSR